MSLGPALLYRSNYDLFWIEYYLYSSNMLSDMLKFMKAVNVWILIKIMNTSYLLHQISKNNALLKNLCFLYISLISFMTGLLKHASTVLLQLSIELAHRSILTQLSIIRTVNWTRCQNSELKRHDFDMWYKTDIIDVAIWEGL